MIERCFLLLLGAFLVGAPALANEFPSRPTARVELAILSNSRQTPRNVWIKTDLGLECFFILYQPVLRRDQGSAIVAALRLVPQQLNCQSSPTA